MEEDKGESWNYVQVGDGWLFFPHYWQWGPETIVLRDKLVSTLGEFLVSSVVLVEQRGQSTRD